MVAAKPPVAVFSRDGQTREAYDAGEAVTLRATGWQEVRPSAPAAKTADEPEADDEKPKGRHK